MSGKVFQCFFGGAIFPPNTMLCVGAQMQEELFLNIAGGSPAAEVHIMYGSY